MSRRKNQKSSSGTAESLRSNDFNEPPVFMCDDILFVESEVLAKEFYEEAVARGARFNTDLTGKDFCFYPIIGTKD